MLNYDAHAEAQARFTQDTQAIVSQQTINNRRLNLLTNVEKGILIGEIGIDGVQTHDFLRKGICHESDIFAKPFVHSVPIAVASTAALSYLVTSVKPGWFRNALLGVAIVGEGLNIAHNHSEGCE
jgi:hypothetical protein